MSAASGGEGASSADDAVARDMQGRPEAFGAAVGIGGPAAGWVGANTDELSAAIDGVSPGTWRGAWRVVAFIVVVVGLAVLGRLAVPGLGAAWLLIAFAAMVPVALWWSRRRPLRRPPVLQ